MNAGHIALDLQSILDGKRGQAASERIIGEAIRALTSLDQGSREAAPVPAEPAPGGWRDVLAERRRQVEAEGWTTEHDDEHSKGEMAGAAAVFALCAAAPEADRAVMDEFGQYNSVSLHLRKWWPWSEDWLKPKSRRADLVRAGALILAEIERLDRAAAPQPATGEA